MGEGKHILSVDADRREDFLSGRMIILRETWREMQQKMMFFLTDEGREKKPKQNSKTGGFKINKARP